MKLRAPRPTPLRAIRPSAALGARYEARLDAAIAQMHRSLLYWLRARYRASGAATAADASPTAELRRAMRKLARRWQAQFDTLAPKLAIWFATAANERVTADLGRMLRDAGFSVRMQMTRAQNVAYQAVIGENVALIKSVAGEHLAKVEAAVMRSVQTGRDLGTLTKALEENYGVTRRRAALIAKTQNNMATATLARTRQLELGITKARWLHSAGGRVPRPEHVEFSGKTYDVARGAFLEGVWTWPGREINCRCVSIPIIPGFDD